MTITDIRWDGNGQYVMRGKQDLRPLVAVRGDIPEAFATCVWCVYDENGNIIAWDRYRNDLLQVFPNLNIVGE